MNYSRGPQSAEILTCHLSVRARSNFERGLRAQVVYSGAVFGAADYFKDLGYSPESPEVNIADYMLDVVIRSPPEDVDHMVTEFKT